MASKESQLDDNTRNAYFALHDSMVEMYEKGDTENCKRAEQTAHILIAHDDIPLLIRCRALCILGSSYEGDFVRYAEESVHFAEVGLHLEEESEKKEAGKGDLDTAKLILKCCKEVLEDARAARDEMEAEEEQDEEDEEDEDEEIVWDPEWDEEHKARVKATWAPWPPEPTTAPQAGDVSEPAASSQENEALKTKK